MTRRKPTKARANLSAGERKAVPVETPVKTPDLEPMEVSAAHVLKAICEERHLTSILHIGLARQATACLCAGQVSAFTALMGLLPGPPLKGGAHVVHGSNEIDPRQAILDSVNAMFDAEELVEDRAVPGSELERLRKRVAELEAAGGCAQPEPKVITPTEAEITPPSELGDRHLRVTPADPVIEGEYTREADPTRPGEWDASANGRAWQAWHDAGGGADYGYGTFSPGFRR